MHLCMGRYSDLEGTHSGNPLEAGHQRAVCEAGVCVCRQIWRSASLPCLPLKLTNVVM